MDFIFKYCFIVYFFYHLLSQSEVLSKPRAWFIRTFPRFITYILGCPFCFTWWISILWTLLTWYEIGFVINTEVIFIAPVINYFVGAVADALRSRNQSLCTVSPEVLTQRIKQSITEDLRKGGSVLTWKLEDPT